MKPLSLTTLLPATAIAVGVTAIASQPSQAYNYGYDQDYSSYRDWSYGRARLRLPSLEQAYRHSAPNYHYAYYYVARPEYLL